MSEKIHCPSPDEVARDLARAHRQAEPAITRIVQLHSAEVEGYHEPIKLLEVNPDTSPSGILPIVFAPDPPEIPFPSVVIEVTEQEYQDILDGRLVLPDGWRIGAEV